MPTLKINDIIVGERARKDMGNIAALATSMKKHGQYYPVLISEKNELIDGQRRMLAAKSIGWTEIDAKIQNIEDMLSAEYETNELRKEFTPSERVALAEKIRERIGDRRTQEGVSGQLAGKETRDEAAKIAGFSSTTDYRRTKEVVEKGVPELVDALDNGEVSVSAAATVAGLPKAEQREAVKTKTVAEAAKERMDALAREKLRAKWINLIGTDSKSLKKKILANPAAYSDEMLQKSLPPCCPNCLRRGPPTRPCDDCELLRKPSLLGPEPEVEGVPDSPAKPKKSKSEYQKLKDETIALQSKFTRIIKEKGDFPERLCRFLTLNNLVEHKSDVERFFRALKGVPTLIEAAMTDEDYKDYEIVEMFKKANGTIPFVPERIQYFRNKKKKKR